MKLQGREGWLRPGTYLVAVRAFWELLRQLDSSLSGEENGRVGWELSACKRSGPAEIVFLGHIRKPPKDVVGEIRRTLVAGIQKLSATDERPHGFTDAALAQLQVLAQQRASMDGISIGAGDAEEWI